MKVAIIHEWFTAHAGSEKVTEQLLLLYPEADLFAVVDFLPEKERGFLRGRGVHTSFIQRLPFAKKYFRHYLALMPLAIEQFDLSQYDLVLSSSHAVAKGVVGHPFQTHICYCHSPIRYAWDLQADYLRGAKATKGLKSFFIRWILHYLRGWDFRTAQQVDAFIANSSFIKTRIAKYYRRDAVVINPPVDLENFALETEKEDYYLAASRLVPYKNMPLIARAFRAMPDKKLVIIGDGSDLPIVKKIVASAPNITFLAYQPDGVLRQKMARAKAFVFAALEDFGIMPVEAQACGTPVIAYGKGGALDSIQGLDSPTPTGIFFKEQTEGSIIEAVMLFEKEQARITPEACRANAERFSEEKFREQIKGFVEETVANASV
jgi:glycosyltransferase involved in cell wall biosynthesis